MNVRRWLRRGRGSVRLRVTLLAGGLFAVTLVVASLLLLQALEGTLVGDLRSADRAALQQQATRVFTTGLPPGSVAIGAEVGAAYELPPQGNRALRADGAERRRPDDGRPRPAQRGPARPGRLHRHRADGQRRAARHRR